MELSELIARAPWTASVTPAGYYRSVFAAFLADYRRGNTTLQIAPAPGRRPSTLPRHSWPELFLQLAGTTWFTTPGGNLVSKPGTLAMIPRGTPHGERWSSVDPSHALVVAMPRDGRLAVQTAVLEADGVRRPRHAQVFADEEGATAIRLCDETAAVARLATGHGDETVRPLIEVLLGRLERCAAAGALAASVNDQMIDRCLRLLTTHLNNADLSVTNIAEKLGVSADHLGRTFRRATGETLLAHIARRRIHVACELLAEPGRTIAEVSRLCGIDDPAYFSRTFRRLTGCDPRSYRRRQATTRRRTRS